MSKKKLLFIAPVKSLSGYGKHSRLIAAALFNNPRVTEVYDIVIGNTRWGETPQTALDPTMPDNLKILSHFLKGNTIDFEPDLTIQMTIPAEFTRFGNKMHIGITAGTEASYAPLKFINGCNNSDLVIVPSKFTRDVLLGTIIDEKNNQTQEIVRTFKVDRPVEVLFEGTDVSVYNKKTITPSVMFVEKMKQIEDKWCYLFVGHFLEGRLFEDRKNVSSLIFNFLKAFAKKKNRPALVLKTSGAGFSITERDRIVKKINDIQQVLRDEGYSGKLPNIYLINGDFSDDDMNALYNHPKIKAFATMTHAEGYMLPLAEFAMTGKPIIAPDYSGYLDFLHPEYSILLPGKLEKIHGSAANEWLPKDAEWFKADFNYTQHVLREVYEKYDSFVEKSRKLPKHIKDNFSLEAMGKKLDEIFERYNLYEAAPKVMKLNLPKLKKISSND